MRQHHTMCASITQCAVAASVAPRPRCLSLPLSIVARICRAAFAARATIMRYGCCLPAHRARLPPVAMFVAHVLQPLLLPPLAAVAHGLLPPPRRYHADATPLDSSCRCHVIFTFSYDAAMPCRYALLPPLPPLITPLRAYAAIFALRTLKR